MPRVAEGRQHGRAFVEGMEEERGGYVLVVGGVGAGAREAAGCGGSVAAGNVRD